MPKLNCIWPCMSKTPRLASLSTQAVKERWKNVDLLLSDKGDLDTQDMEV